MALPNAQYEGHQPEGLWPTPLGVSLRRASFIRAWQVAAVTFDAASVAAAAVVEQAVTIVGLTTNDLVLAVGQTFTANILEATARVSAADTAQLRLVNPTAAPIDPVSKTYFFIAFQVR